MKVMNIVDTFVKQTSIPKKILITLKIHWNQELKSKLVKAKMIDVRPLIIIIGHMVSYWNSHVINNLKFPTFHKHASISM